MWNTLGGKEEDKENTRICQGKLILEFFPKAGMKNLLSTPSFH